MYKEEYMRALETIAITIIIIGAINWGLIGLFDFNLVTFIFGGNDSVFTKIVYILVGISGLLSIKVLIELFED
jgi:uncharacterized membrane protein YuzA (DUF378 family)